MKKNFIPITDLRKTNELLELIHSDEPVFVTKNGYLEAVIMSGECYDDLNDFSITPDKEKENIHINKKNLPYQIHDGLLNVAACSLSLKIGDVDYNVQEIKKKILEAQEKHVQIIAFPELCLCGYTCGDLFNQVSLLQKVTEGLKQLKDFSKDKDILFFVGAPLSFEDSLYNCAVAISNGLILAIYPKRYIPNYKEFYEGRYFIPYTDENSFFSFDGQEIPFGNKILLINDDYEQEIVSCEICEDAWASHSPSLDAANAGATILLNLSSSNETINKDKVRRGLVKEASRKLCGAYIYVSASFEESTTDLLFSGHNLIYECGDKLGESPLFYPSMLIQTIDIERIVNKRRSQNTFLSEKKNGFTIVHYQSYRAECNKYINRNLSRFPFVYHDFDFEETDYEKVLQMQALSLAKRLKSINCHVTVLGLSGGLDSTLALLAIHKAYDILNYDHKDIHVLTLPCFGTSERTHANAVKLAKAMGNSFKEINISDSVRLHLNDIDHDDHHFDVIYENAQARMRTMILMDYANKENGIVIGTGDLSEIALGWSTYNGDHMSMYAINASIPKTLIRAMFAHFSTLKEYENIKDVLLDVLDTPISPELLPTLDGQIDQKTEEIVGPYQLNDFFLYHYMSEFYSLRKVFDLAKYVYKDIYSVDEIKKWLKNFVKRFFSSQFKRSCMPDGAKITAISLSPRGDLRLPSDINYKFILEEIDNFN